MRFKRNLLMVLFSLSFTVSAFAQTSIKAEVDKASITTDDTVTYKLVIASSEKNIPIPQIPRFEGFSVISQAQSSAISFTKDGVKTTLVYTYVLSPKDIGEFKIEPSIIKIKDRIYSTDTFEINVSQGEGKPKVKPKRESSQPEKSLPEIDSQEPQITL